MVALRSKALTVLAGKGGMLSIAEPAEQVRKRLPAFGDRVSVAAVNGPSATVVSGEPSALEELAGICEAEGVRARMIPVDYASHSAQVDALEDDILQVLEGITPGPARIAMVSAMTGEMLAGPELDAAYWYASLRATVEFDRAVRVLAERGHRAFVEVSPHPVLTGAITDTLESAGTSATLVTGTLRRDEGGPARLLASLAEAHVNGVRIDWTAVHDRAEQVELPTYAFQHRRFWAPPMPAPQAPGVPNGDGAATPAEAAFWAGVENGDVERLAGALDIDGDRLGELLPALASWRRRERDESSVAGWRYRVSWQPLPEPAPMPLTGTWLVVANAGQAKIGQTGECVQAMADRGAGVEILEVGAGEADRGLLTGRLAEILAGDDGSRFTGVLSCLALDETPLADFPQVPAGLAGTLLLVQALGDAGIAAPVWAVTQGAVSTGPDDVLTHPVQAQVWGLGRVVGLEHPDRWGGLIDLPAAWDDRTAARLGAVLAGGTEDQVAVRASGLLTRRLVGAPRTKTRRETWTPRGTVLVTGGTGEVGPHLVRWLVRSGAPRVVLTSRSGVSAAAAVALAEVAATGTEISFVSCDIAQRSEVETLLAKIAADGPPLRTVMHAANTVDLTLVADTGPSDLSKALGAKAAGAVWLDELTADLDLDAFVLFSSIAATWGSAEHAAYAAGNAFIDALAQSRRARGLPATSVAWGVWDTQDWAGSNGVLPDGPGIVTPARLVRQGMSFLAPDRALTALGQALTDDETFLAVADVDWTRFAPVYSAMRSWPLLNEIPAVQRLAADRATVPDETGELAGRLAGMSPSEQERAVADLVRTHAAAVLGHASAGEIPAGREFRDMGFDSLTAVDLRNRLSAATGVKLPSTAVFDYPSPAVLAEHLRAALSQGADRLGSEPAAETRDEQAAREGRVADAGSELRRVFEERELRLLGDGQVTVLDGLAASVRGLIESVVLTDVEAAEVAEVAREVDALTRRLAVAGRAVPPMAQDDDGFRQLASPVTGDLNPVAPPIAIDTSSDGTARAEFTLSPVYEGPPGFVHGGVAAMILDHLCGAAAMANGTPGMTVSLEMRYSRPTPHSAPLTAEAKTVRAEGRRTFVEGSIFGPAGEVTITATAVFVTPTTD